MLAEVIRDLIKAEKNTNDTSEQLLAWERRGDAQRVWSAISNSLSDVENLTRYKQ